MAHTDPNFFIDYLKEKGLVPTVTTSEYSISLERREFVTDLLKDDAVKAQLIAFFDEKGIDLSILKNRLNLHQAQSFGQRIRAWGFKGFQIAAFNSTERTNFVELYLVPGPRYSIDFVKFNEEFQRHV